MADDNSERFEAVKVAASNVRAKASILTSEPLFNISSSIVKRTSRDKQDVVKELQSNGFVETGSLMNGKVGYYENSGVNITVISTRRGSIVMPSGPVRGKFLGNNAVDISLNK